MIIYGPAESRHKPTNARLSRNEMIISIIEKQYHDHPSRKEIEGLLCTLVTVQLALIYNLIFPDIKALQFNPNMPNSVAYYRKD